MASKSEDSGTTKVCFTRAGGQSIRERIYTLPMFPKQQKKSQVTAPEIQPKHRIATKSPHTAAKREREGNIAPVQSSDKISDVHGHLVDLRAVVLLDVPKDTDVILAHKVDRHTLQSRHTENFHASQE